MQPDPRRLPEGSWQKLKRGWKLFDAYTDAIAGVLGIFLGIGALILVPKDWWFGFICLVGGGWLLFGVVRRSEGWSRRRD